MIDWKTLWIGLMLMALVLLVASIISTIWRVKNERLTTVRWIFTGVFCIAFILYVIFFRL